MEFDNVETRGKEILTTLGEKVNPQHTTLLLFDMQNDTAKTGGKCHKAGRPLGHYEKAIPNIQAFLKEARNYGLLVVHVITTGLPYGLGDSGAWLDQRVRSLYTDLTICLEGAWGNK